MEKALRDMSVQAQSSADRLISMDEAAAYLDLAKSTLYTMVSQRRVPYVKVGRLTKFDRALLDAWIKRNTVMPMPSKTP